MPSFVGEKNDKIRKHTGPFLLLSSYDFLIIELMRPINNLSLCSVSLEGKEIIPLNDKRNDCPSSALAN